MLRDLDLQPSYRSGRDALLDDFYIPCLQESQLYDRAVGFFSSSLIHAVAIAYSEFASREGRMRLLCSPALKPADFEAMKSGQERAHRMQDAIRAELHEMIANPQSLPATRLLATLVAAGIIEVRLAFSTNPNGIFHDKIGVFTDLEDRRVSFVGSANETWAAWGLNHESFEVFCSWRGERELLRTRSHVLYFEDLWAQREVGVRVESLDAVTSEELLGVAAASVQEAIDQVREPQQSIHRARRTLLPHQEAVLASWEGAGRRGIVSFATGAGKTLAAIEAVRRWTALGRPALVLVPSAELHRQWVAELERELPHAQLLLAGAGHHRGDWLRVLTAFRRSKSVGQRVIVCTMQTFASSEFQERLMGGLPLLLVVDEMHRAGSDRTLRALESTLFDGTMGLSATYRRQWDLAGTQRLVKLMGAVLEPVIGIAEAIALGLLVPYDYRLQTLQLAGEELERYEVLTKRIKRLVAEGGPLVDGNDYLRMLLIQRAHVLKHARSKPGRAIEVLSANYEGGDRWLVYADDQDQLRSIIALCRSAGLPVMEYHSNMQSDRREVLRSLDAFGGIIVAIRCLDEGVDIPICNKALIVASSTVEREYVQRRGRILRRAPGKNSATVHDLLLVDERGGALTAGEARRALEFARIARNPGARAQLQLIIALSSDVGGIDFFYTPADRDTEEIAET